jgi:hypothetical protein
MINSSKSVTEGTRGGAALFRVGGVTEDPSVEGFSTFFFAAGGANKRPSALVEITNGTRSIAERNHAEHLINRIPPFDAN